MKQTVTQGEFVKAFDDMNRGNNFSINGRRALYDYITEYEENTDTETELDVIALCCEYSEYPSCLEAAEDHGAKMEDMQPETDDEEDKETAAQAWLEERAQVILFDGGVIVSAF